MVPRLSPVPVAATAQRPTWAELPLGLRSEIENRLGDSVESAVSQRSGFTPGFASRLVLTDGSRWFVKAASSEHGWLQDCYAAEAVKLRLLPAGVPAPILRQRFDVRVDGIDWLVLVIDDVDGRPPVRPLGEAEATAALAAVADLSRRLTPAPAGFAWVSLAEELAGMQPVGDDPLDRREWRPHRAELDELLTATAAGLLGETLVHGDVRDDNLLVAADQTVWVCDWNFPTLGPIWADALCLAISMSGDGLDADALLADTGLIEAADADAVDCLLLHLARYFAAAAGQDPVLHSPYLRTHQAWYAEVTGDWLRRRRGW